jgi:hypothetical protein
MICLDDIIKIQLSLILRLQFDCELNYCHDWDVSTMLKDVLNDFSVCLHCMSFDICYKCRFYNVRSECPDGSLLRHDFCITIKHDVTNLMQTIS